MSFSELGLSQPIVRAVSAAGYSVPTPIQAQAIPIVISGRDLLGVAQTGTGKTAAFALPIIERLLAVRGTQHSGATPPAPPLEGGERLRNGARDTSRVSAKARKIRVLVLSPTRELAVQIGESFGTYSAGTPLRHTVVFGGVSQFHQVQALRHGVDILVATPGRLMDLREQGFIDLSHVQVLVLDEADRMLDMGFLPVVRQIVELLPQARQTLLFSATMPREIRELADSILSNPASVEIAPVATTAENISQSVYFVEKSDKLRLLRQVLRRSDVTRTLVFTKTKRAADKLAHNLDEGGFRVAAIHGNRTQAQRQRALDNFKSGRTPVLIATDLAARGIDVDGISHVVNFDLPLEVDNYVHRIGRTARAGASGIAISFCSADERGRLKAIERLIRQRLEVCRDQVRREPIVTATPSEPVTEPFGVFDDDVIIAHRESLEAARPVHRQSNRPPRPGRPTYSPRGGTVVENDFAGNRNRSQRPRRFGKHSRRKSRHPAAASR